MTDLRAGTIAKPTVMDEMHRRVMQITGADPLPYGIDANRGPLQEALQSALEQGIIDRVPPLEELFAAGTQTLSA